MKSNITLPTFNASSSEISFIVDINIIMDALQFFRNKERDFQEIYSSITWLITNFFETVGKLEIHIIFGAFRNKESQLMVDFFYSYDPISKSKTRRSLNNFARIFQRKYFLGYFYKVLSIKLPLTSSYSSLVELFYSY
jgi:hypothetical protein